METIVYLFYKYIINMIISRNAASGQVKFHSKFGKKNLLSLILS